MNRLPRNEAKCFFHETGREVLSTPQGNAHLRAEIALHMLYLMMYGSMPLPLEIGYRTISTDLIVFSELGLEILTEICNRGSAHAVTGARKGINGSSKSSSHAKKDNTCNVTFDTTIYDSRNKRSY
jgi:hypothetical protein